MMAKKAPTTVVIVAIVSSILCNKNDGISNNIWNLSQISLLVRCNIYNMPNIDVSQMADDLRPNLGCYAEANAPHFSAPNMV